jgi:hypothetical protein
MIKAARVAFLLHREEIDYEHDGDGVDWAGPRFLELGWRDRERRRGEGDWVGV